MNSTNEQKVLIIGCTGMLGHEVLRVFKESCFETYGTHRWKNQSQEDCTLYLDLLDGKEAIASLLKKIKPNIVINCAGILKPNVNKDPVITVLVNSLSPHILAQICQKIDARFIHVTTDCVYDGVTGNYNETDKKTPVDFYGLSKLTGEVTYGNNLSVRTSYIGHELREKKYNLLDWFLYNTALECDGFTNHYWNGVTTIELAKFLVFLCREHRGLNGILHFYGETVTKYNLLNLFKKVYEKNIEINEYRCTSSCNRTLTSLYLEKLGYTVSGLKEQLEELKAGFSKGWTDPLKTTNS